MLAVVFPGQGSQAPGMGRALIESGSPVFGEVSLAVGRDVAELCLQSDEETLRQTQNAQIALYTVGLAAFGALREADPNLPVRAAAGHSVGEYAALAAAGAVSIADGARLVQRRGELMASTGQGRLGAMAAVLGLDRETVEAQCAKASGVCVVANDNCPGQLVVSGDSSAVAEVGKALREAGAMRFLPLSVSGAFHSPLMEAASLVMEQVLGSVPFKPGGFPVYSNVSARPSDAWTDLLVKQLKGPVRWTETIQNMTIDGFDTFVECGHGSVLSGLIKRTAPLAATHAVGSPDSAAATVEALKERRA